MSATAAGGWHVTDAVSRAYAQGQLDDPASWSLEAHVERCGACARLVSAAADPAVLARVRERVVRGVVASPTRGFVCLTVVPALGVMWFVAVAGVVVGAGLLDVLDATGVPALLLVAPLLPLLGLAVGCSPSVDRSAELLASAPVSTLHVLLLRAAAVLTVSVPPLLLMSVVTGTNSLRWLAPSAALVALSLALTTRVRVEVATGCAAALWVAATLAPVALRVPSPPGLRPDVTIGWWTLTAASLALLGLQREHLDRWTSRTGEQS